MLTDYTTVLNALKERGLPAELASDQTGSRIIVPLGGVSQITIGDLNGALPQPQHLNGWSAHYTNLAGDRLEPAFYRTTHTGVDSLAEAVTDYVRLRNSMWLPRQMAELVNRRLRSQALPGNADAYGDSAGFWAIVNGYDEQGVGRHLVISSYPRPDEGIHTAGDPVTGWAVTEQRPGADSAIVYDAPDNPDAEQAAVKVGTWIREHAARRRPSGRPQPARQDNPAGLLRRPVSPRNCSHPKAALVDDDAEPGAMRCLDCAKFFPAPTGAALACGHPMSVATETGACIACSNTRKRALLTRADGHGLPSDAALEILRDTLRALDGTTVRGLAWYPDPQPLSRTNRENGKCYRITFWLLTDHAARDAGMLG